VQFERTPLEKAAGGAVLLVVVGLTIFICYCAVAKVDIEKYDQYIWGLLTPFLKELSLLTVGRGGNGNGGNAKKQLPPDFPES